MTPSEDMWPPIAAPGWSKPLPMPAPINSAGCEDSPFIAPDGQSFYFFFTPDIRIPVERQILDDVTGIWESQWIDGNWGEPQRVILAQPDEMHLDGCPFVNEESMYCCSVRVGNLREIDIYTADRVEGRWRNWRNAGEAINLEIQVGEMHISADGQTLIFASQRPGGLGGYDLWASTWNGSGWGQAVNLGGAVNTSGDENRPFLSADGKELWFDGASHQGKPGPAIFRSRKLVDGTWDAAEEIVSQFAGEPNLSANGAVLYFVHHFFSADLSRIIEADIYMSYRMDP